MRRRRFGFHLLACSGVLALVILAVGCGPGKGPTSQPSMAATRPSQVSQADVQAAAEKLKAGLPEGWSVQVKDKTISLRREKQVRFVNLINADIGLPGESHQQYLMRHSIEIKYVIGLWFVPAMTAQERDKAVRENQETSKQGALMQERLRGVPAKFDQYVPRSEEEKQLVNEYQELRKRWHTMPDLSDGKYVIYITARLEKHVPLHVGTRLPGCQREDRLDVSGGR
jgi:hypothetical protein